MLARIPLKQQYLKVVKYRSYILNTKVLNEKSHIMILHLTAKSTFDMFYDHATSR